MAPLRCLLGACLLLAARATVQSLDCKFRQVGLDFAQALQPFRDIVSVP